MEGGRWRCRGPRNRDMTAQTRTYKPRTTSHEPRKSVIEINDSVPVVALINIKSFQSHIFKKKTYKIYIIEWTSSPFSLISQNICMTSVHIIVWVHFSPDSSVKFIINKSSAKDKLQLMISCLTLPEHERKIQDTWSVIERGYCRKWCTWNSQAHYLAQYYYDARYTRFD